MQAESFQCRQVIEVQTQSRCKATDVKPVAPKTALGLHSDSTFPKNLRLAIETCCENIHIGSPFRL